MRRLVCILLACASCYALFAQDNIDGKDILMKSDAAYMPSTVFFNLQIDCYEKGIKKQWYNLDCYVKGSGRYLVLFKDPGIMRGQGELRLKDTIYHYVKKVDSLEQVSAKVNFFQSNLSQEDIMSTMLSEFYDISGVEKTTGDDGKQLFVLHLTAKTKKVAYARIEAYIECDTYYPVRREFYSLSGQKIKEIKYDKISRQDGKLTGVDFTIYDSLKKDNYSKVAIDKLDTEKQISDNWFSIAYLKAATK